MNGVVACAEIWLTMNCVSIIGPHIYTVSHREQHLLGRLRILVEDRATIAKVGTNLANIKISHIIIKAIVPKI